MDRGIWTQFKRRPTGLVALILLASLLLLAIYAPLLASSKPLYVRYHGNAYFPLFQYLFFRGFYTKAIDLFFNLLMLTLPLALLVTCFRFRKWGLTAALLLQIGAFIFLLRYPIADPASATSYAQLKPVLRAHLQRDHHQKASASGITPWQERRHYLEAKRERLEKAGAFDQLQKLEERERWLASESRHIAKVVMPLLRPFHWEERSMGRYSESRWWLRSRVTGKDLVASLLFGIRVSIVVGVVATTLSLLFGIPLGAIAGFLGGKLDLVLSRLIEIWEGMPSFLMLLMTVAILQSKSILLVIIALACFSWPPLCRMVRAEVLRQKALPYALACRAQGYPKTAILFREILPNAIPPVLSLLPFILMVAITSEAGLAFLGLGEEGSCSLGVLMDEGRAAFPAESGLLWPPAILLSLLLIAIALVGDTLRDALDPKLQ